ncbi:hypothetical protein [uncultured Bradyrhizobium sp.]|uniref:hypothetical protein n=1 Tax=uncultured Bradyrhizobium sp. TaxID=199684 RepID=UPI0035CAAE8E
MSRPSLRSLAFAASAAGTLIAPQAAPAASTTACTALNICYCINADNKAAIEANIARIRQMLADERGRGRSIGYMSIPLSPAGGGYFPINQEIARQSKDRIEKRFGASSAWMLDPGAAGNLPAGATGADYMYMWTTILEGPRGMGEDFDFFYFVGPTDFGRFFALSGEGDFTTIEAYFDSRAATDPEFKKAVDQGKLTKFGFRNYYGLKASVAFSYGSHDEWNIARLLNERRRGAADFGIANQLPVLFDGQPVNPGSYEASTASGDVGRCIN